eukprot:10002094-Lingulodinium_polyedra.AAC.1
MYGAARGPPPARDLANLRKTARDTVARGAARCANKMVFGLLNPAWRLDPGAPACVGPVAQA